MSTAPDWFLDLLARTFDGRLRLRYSLSRHEFHIEQRVGRASVTNFPVDEGDDDLIRARDGYDFVMAIRPGDRMPCPDCHLTLRVPVMDTWNVTCPYCSLKGRKTSVVAGYWPLNERLIAHLQKIDPLRSASRELAENADRRNRLMLASQENDISREGMAALDERFNRIVGIPQVGFTGKEKAWQHA